MCFCGGTGVPTTKDVEEGGGMKTYLMLEIKVTEISTLLLPT